MRQVHDCYEGQILEDDDFCGVASGTFTIITALLAPQMSRRRRKMMMWSQFPRSKHAPTSDLRSSDLACSSSFFRVFYNRLNR